MGGGGIEQKRKERKKLINMDNSVVIAGRAAGEVEEGIRGINGDGRRLDLG